MPILKERGYFWWSEETVPSGKRMPESGFVGGELIIDDDGRINLIVDEPFLHPDFTRNQSIKAHKKNYDFKEYGISGVLNESHGKVFLHGIMDGFFFKSFQIRDCFVGTKLFPYHGGSFSFVDMTISLQGYEEWLCMNGLKFKGDGKEFSILFNSPDDHKYLMGWGTLSVEFDIGTPFSPIAIDELTLKQTGFFKCAFSEGQPISVLQRKHRLLSDFLVLLTNSERRLEWPTVHLGNDRSPYKYYFGRSKYTATPPLQHECWVVFPTVQDRFGQLFAAWEEKHDIFGSGFYLYLATRRGIPTYIENRFLDLMMGFESFHRHKHPDMKDEEAIATREKILEKTTDQEERKWLCDKLQWVHEPSAKKRLLQTLSEIALDLASRRIKLFAGTCIEARNSITHSTNDHMKTNSWKILSDLDRKSDALAIMYHLVLLHEIEIGKTILDDLLKRRSEIRVPLISAGLMIETPEATPKS